MISCIVGPIVLRDMFCAQPKLVASIVIKNIGLYLVKNC
jgi:hypothetical protein